MDKLTERTVFHEIELKKDDDDILEDGEIVLPDPEWEGLTPDEKNIHHEDNSDDEWDTDLDEDEGSGTSRRIIMNDYSRQIYLAACNQLGIVPVHCFLKAINTEVMNLNFQGLGPLGTRAVATGMVKDSFTTHLYLAGNFIGHDGIRNVCDMLRENQYITHIDLSENELDTYAAEMLASVFKENDTLTTMKLSGNNFKDEDAEYFASILKIGSRYRNGQFTGLRSLDLSHNLFCDDGASILGHAIGDTETLTNMNLSWNRIRTPGIACIAKGIEENNSLKSLDLSSNGVDNKGADYIGEALEHNETLTDLNLNSNRIGLEGVVSLFKHLGKNEALKIIRLSNNPITLQGPVAALKLLEEGDSVLRELEIADACVPREFHAIYEEAQTLRPDFKVHLAGFMNSRDMCKAEVKSNKDSWKKDPMLVFVHFIESKKIKLFDMFKMFDRDKSCTVSKDEFRDGLKQVGCPLDDKEFNHLLNILDVNKDGEVDIGELLDGVEKNKKRLEKYTPEITSKTPEVINSSSNPSTRPTSKTENRTQSKLSSSRPTSGYTSETSSDEEQELNIQVKTPSPIPSRQQSSTPNDQISAQDNSTAEATRKDKDINVENEEDNGVNVSLQKSITVV
ncbi:hypothetical protein ACF0H5_002923 [Mactra antiquata]